MTTEIRPPFRFASGEALDAGALAEALRPRPRRLEANVGAAPDDLRDQFVLFQRADDPAVREPTEVEPRLEGSDDLPDVLVGLEMLAFHLGADEGAGPGTRATLRLNFGMDEASPDRRFEPTFWSIAAGLRLFDEGHGRRSASRDLRGDFRAAFGGRPIEVPGGLGRLSFEVVAHREPRWWRRVFGFAEGPAGRALVSALGFPAVTHRAIAVVDELLNALEESRPQPLFRSQPLRLALSRHARDGFAPGGRVRLGCLNPGFAILARGRDYATLVGADAAFDATLGRLVPAGDDRRDDPFAAMTYAVLRVGMRPTRLDPMFRLG